MLCEVPSPKSLDPLVPAVPPFPESLFATLSCVAKRSFAEKDRESLL